MAIGLNFLSKTSGMKDIMSPSKTNDVSKTGSSQSNSSIFASNPQSSSSSNKTDMASMNTSDLIKYVYQNNANVDIKDNTGSKKGKSDEANNVKLPVTVEYGDEKFGASGKKFDDVVKEISAKTHDSVSKVETELKRKYATTKGASGGSLNMQA